jgi:hypothetical protein
VPSLAAPSAMARWNIEPAASSSIFMIISEPVSTGIRLSAVRFRGLNGFSADDATSNTKYLWLHCRTLISRHAADPITPGRLLNLSPTLQDYDAPGSSDELRFTPFCRNTGIPSRPNRPFELEPIRRTVSQKILHRARCANDAWKLILAGIVRSAATEQAASASLVT